MQPKKSIIWPKIPGWVYPTVIIVIATFLCLVKLWLVDAQDLTFQGVNKYDDMLFIELATNIKDTGWLGPYTYRTLAKGPFYPIFLAVNSSLGLPLLLSQNLLHLLSRCSS